ncbi:hypothetical protein [Flavisolibacter nicotianae]|uniref:hypothetical protein n=1 Tax=Flavisolibacter nicotianae TaxID=2364882 RepID=UPI000EB2E7BA|nr:hypothetical protein [Flavisolibacter nicotianae]
MKYNLLCFAVGVFLGLFLGLVYGTAALCNNPLPVSVPAPKELKKEVTQFETGYAKSFDTLKKESNKLHTELAATKFELQKTKRKSQVLQSQVYSLLDSRFDKQQADTISTKTSCDSLAATVSELLQSNAQKDTLYEGVTANLEQQVANKDTTISLKDAQYTGLKTAFEKSIQGQQLLVDQNKQLSKQYKRQKVKCKLLSAVLIALSGAAATYFIYH